MSLLKLDGVSKHFQRGARGPRERVALQDVSLEVEEGEIVAVWGRPRSGRTTLLHVASGVVPPSGGTVRFDGVDLARCEALGRSGGIGFASTSFRRVIGDSVLEHVSAPLLGRGMSALSAQSHAYEALRRVDAVDFADLEAEELSHAETVRVALARALATRPRLLMVDEPMVGVSLARGRDQTLALLGSIAHQDGIAVLMTAGEAGDLAGADRALTIDHGMLRGRAKPERADVVVLHAARGESSA